MTLHWKPAALEFLIPLLFPLGCTGVYCHAWFTQCWGRVQTMQTLPAGLHPCPESSLLTRTLGLLPFTLTTFFFEDPTAKSSHFPGYQELWLSRVQRGTGIHTVQLLLSWKHDKCNYQFGRISLVYIWVPLYLSAEFSTYVISSPASCTFSISIAPAHPGEKYASQPTHLEMLKAGAVNPPGDLHSACSFCLTEPSFSSGYRVGFSCKIPVMLSPSPFLKDGSPEASGDDW